MNHAGIRSALSRIAWAYLLIHLHFRLNNLDLLPDWAGAAACIATNRITVEGRKVGYCYREIPDGNWDSGWRFTAGDESDEYMDDPNNAGIYKLNTICNDDPDIISLLNTPAPCAFEREDRKSVV